MGGGFCGFEATQKKHPDNTMIVRVLRCGKEFLYKENFIWWFQPVFHEERYQDSYRARSNQISFL